MVATASSAIPNIMGSISLTTTTNGGIWIPPTQSYYVGGDSPTTMYTIKGKIYPHDTSFVFSFQSAIKGVPLPKTSVDIADTGLNVGTLGTWSYISSSLPWTAVNNYAPSSSAVTAVSLGVSYSATTTVVSGGCIIDLDPYTGYPLPVNYYIPDSSFTVADDHTPFTACTIANPCTYQASLKSTSLTTVSMSYASSVTTF